MNTIMCILSPPGILAAWPRLGDWPPWPPEDNNVCVLLTRSIGSEAVTGRLTAVTSRRQCLCSVDQEYRQWGQDWEIDCRDLQKTIMFMFCWPGVPAARPWLGDWPPWPPEDNNVYVLLTRSTAGCQLIPIFLYNSYILGQNPTFWKTSYFSYIFLYFEHHSYILYWIGCRAPQNTIFFSFFCSLRSHFRLNQHFLFQHESHMHKKLLISVIALKILS